MVRLFAAALAIPLGLDLYMPVLEDNPLTAERINVGRRLFNDRRLSRDVDVSGSFLRHATLGRTAVRYDPSPS